MGAPKSGGGGGRTVPKTTTLKAPFLSGPAPPRVVNGRAPRTPGTPLALSDFEQVEP